MPTSYSGQISTIMNFIANENPKSILDVGIGFGKYGVLSREILDIEKENYYKKDWKVIIDGIEGFKDYKNSIHEYVYNKVFYGLVQDIYKDIEKNYDLIIMIDILEHFEKEVGVQIINELLKKCKSLLISVPAIPSEQSYLNNILETHKSIWKIKDFKKYNIKNTDIIPMGIKNSSIIVLLKGGE